MRSDGRVRRAAGHLSAVEPDLAHRGDAGGPHGLDRGARRDRQPGSPFPPLLKNGAYVRVDQTNNSYVFPGIGLAAIAVHARRISEGMLMAAARALADMSPARLNPHANLLPPVSELRDVSLRVAQAVALAGAQGRADRADGRRRHVPENPGQDVDAGLPALSAPGLTAREPIGR